MTSRGHLSAEVSLAFLDDVLKSSSSSTPSCSIDESYKYIFLPICYSFTFIFSLSLNLVVFYRSLRWNASLIYLVNLASTDLMYDLSLPFLVASYVMRHVCRDLGANGKNRSSETSLGDFNSSHDVDAVHEEYQNCWDDAIDKVFHDYMPDGMTLHLLGFFIPFSVIAWCYSHVVLTIFRTLHSSGGRPTDGLWVPRRQYRSSSRAGIRISKGVMRAVGPDEGFSIFLSARSPYACCRRKSIRTIVTIMLLFALCFFPFHVTRTIFLLLKTRVARTAAQSKQFPRTA